MSKIIGVRFEQAGKLHYFDAADIPLKVNDYVVVETANGLELGKAAISSDSEASGITESLRPVLRKAGPDDIGQARRWAGREKNVLVKCKELATELNLAMKPLCASYNLDGSQLNLLFSAEERIDFRELIRRLSRSLRTRVKLRQVGPRDEAKLVGGIGKCGRPLCCMTFLSEFTPVSIRMAKEQALTLNPMKISGICGRLLCCLGYESDLYHAMKGELPKTGQRVSTPRGEAKVVGGNPLKEAVLVRLESGATVELSLRQVTWQKKPEKQ